MRDAYNHRLRLVELASQRGIKPTARRFATTVSTVRKWLRRHQQHGSAGLVELSRAPHRQPRKASPQIEHDVVELRKTLHTFGARRLIGFPSHAEVYAGGEFVGNAPATLKLSAGKHTVKVTLAGYKEWSREIFVSAGLALKLAATLEKQD